jgi:hypothetical protein
MDAYAGLYRDAWYGDVAVHTVNGVLRMSFTKSPRLVGTLSPWSKDRFLVRWDDRTLDADALVSFVADSKGVVRQMRMQRASARTAGAYDFQDLDLVRLR